MIQVYSAVALLQVDDKILLLKRTADMRSYPNQWCLPGGKQDPGETLAETVCRETLEETGIEVKVLSRLGEVQSSMVSRNLTNIVSVYLVEAAGSLNLHDFPTSEHSGAAWFTLSQVATLDLAGKVAGRTTDLISMGLVLLTVFVCVTC